MRKIIIVSIVILKLWGYFWNYFQNISLLYKKAFLYYLIFYLAAILASYVGWLKNNVILIYLGPVIALSGKFLILSILFAPKLIIFIRKKVFQKDIPDTLDID